MTEASIHGAGEEHSEKSSSSSTMGVEQVSPAVEAGEQKLSAPRGLGEPHPLEKMLEQLRDLRGDIANRVVLSRVEASMPVPVSIQTPTQSPSPHTYTIPVPLVNALPATSPQTSAVPPPIRETASSEPTSAIASKESPLLLTKTETRNVITKSETQSNSDLEQKTDTLSKDPVQALEKALDTILKGYSTSQEPRAQPESHASSIQNQKGTDHLVERSQTTTEQSRPTPAERTTTERALPSNGAEQLPSFVVERTVLRPVHMSDKLLEGQQAIVPTQSGATLHQMPNDSYVPYTKAESLLPSQHPAEQVGHDGHIANQHNSIQQEERRHSEQSEHQRQQRAEQLQLVQQALATYLEQAGIINAPISIDYTPLSIQPRHESTTVAIEKVRESVLDKLTAIQSQLETSSVERKRSERVLPEQLIAIQGREQHLKQAPIHHDLKPSLNLHHNDHTSNSSQLTRLLRDIAPAIAGFVAPAATASARGITPTSITGAHSSLDTLNGLFDLLKRFSARSNNLLLLARMDSPLEKACLSLVTGVALGVIGVEMLIRTANLALAEMLRALRESKKCNENPENEQQLHDELDSELEAYIHHTFIKPIQAGLVADVTGTIIDNNSKAPIPGVLIGSRELGSTISDHHGRFLFKNVTLGTGYALTLYQPLFELIPHELRGVCSEHSHHHIELQRVPLTPEASL